MARYKYKSGDLFYNPQKNRIVEVLDEYTYDLGVELTYIRVWDGKYKKLEFNDQVFQIPSHRMGINFGIYVEDFKKDYWYIGTLEP